MLDNANIAYYPRIYDLAHRFFEESWEKMCGISYPEMINEKRMSIEKFGILRQKNKNANKRPTNQQF